MTIKINFQWNHSIGQQLLFIKNFLRDFSSTSENVILDFRELKFSPPLISVFLSSFLEAFPGTACTNLPSTSYLSFIQFPTGFKPDLIPDWSDKLSSYTNKSYLPLVHFNTSKLEKPSNDRNNVISHICHIIRSITSVPTNYYTGISYLISEISDNIVDHSGCDRGWLSFQYYKTQGFIDFCLADNGIGLLGAYETYEGDKDFSHIRTHIDAIDCVIQLKIRMKEDLVYTPQESC